MQYDIIVIGGGPAGLSAAVRAVWLAAPAATYRARVLVLDAADAPGGLSRWQPLVMNSPGVIFTKRELKAMLSSAVAFGAEIRQERVVSLALAADGSFDVKTSHGSYNALATVIAAGCRLGHAGEHRLFHRNRVLWFHDTATLDHLVSQLSANPSITRVCLCGSEAVAATRRYLGEPSGFALRTFAEPPYASQAQAAVERGRLDEITVDAAGECLLLRFVDEHGHGTEFPCDVLLVDFNAFEKRATTLGFLRLTPRTRVDGFLDPAPDMALNLPGMFSAGDINGGPFSVIKAMSEGTIAGFAAYQYVCQKRNGAPANLFPFFPYEI